MISNIDTFLIANRNITRSVQTHADYYVNVSRAATMVFDGLKMMIIVYYYLFT